MLRYLLLLLVYAFSLSSCAQSNALSPVVDTLMVPLGQSHLVIKKSTYGQPQPYLFLQLHDNEATAEEAAIQYLQQKGGVLLSIENGGQRNVSFELDSLTFTFDPNRIFTPGGLQATLQRFGKSTPEAVAAVQALANTILAQLPDSLLIVAIHNNTDAAFSTLSYRDDTTYQKDAAAVFVNEKEDIDNFSLTTEKDIYSQLAALKYNVVLQDNVNAADDGSLSVYYGKKGVRYVNVEAQHGHLDVQLKMIFDLLATISSKD